MTAWVLGNLDEKGVIPRGIEKTTGPSVDFTDIVSAAYEEQTHNWSLFGLRVDMMDRYQALQDKAKEEGRTLPGISRFEMETVVDNIVNGTPLPDRIPEGRTYWDLSKEDQAKPLAQRLAEFDKASPTKMSDIFWGVQAHALQTEMNVRDVMRRAGPVSGLTGALVGGAGGIMNVTRDPVNFFTLGMGGMGAGYGARVAGEAAVNMGIESGNMVLGALKNRELLGLETTPEQIATQIALTGAASAGLRGLGELPGVYIRRKKAKRLDRVRKINRQIADIEIEAAAERAARGHQPQVAQVKTEQGVTARLEEPIRIGVEAGATTGGRALNVDPKVVAELADDADESLSGAAKEAVDRFVGVGPGAKKDARGLGLGIMDAVPMEKIARGENPRAARELERAFSPIREQLRARYGDTVTLYRTQQPTSSSSGSVFGMPEDGKRAVLSWTANRKFAEHLADVRQIPEPISEARISAMEKTFDATGEVKIEGTNYTLKNKEIYTDLTGKEAVSIEIHDRDGMITDTSSVREFIEGLNAERAESSAANAKRASRILTKEVSLDDVLWVTDRANQSEFIVRTDNVRVSSARGRASREVLNEEIYQDFRLVETQQRILYSELQGTPLRLRATTEADFTFKARALDQAFMDGVFGRPDKTFAEALTEIEVASPVTGETIAPFRFLSDTLASDEEARLAVQEANPHLFRVQASLERKIEKLEESIDKATAKSKTAQGNIAEISRLEKEIAKLRDGIERGDFPKGRKRKLAEKDIADLEARKAEMTPEQGASVARKKLGKLNRDLAAVEDEIERLKEGAWFRRVPEAMNKERARRLTGDPVLSENFTSTAAGRIEFSKQLDTFMDEYEKVKDSNFDALADDLKKDALDEGLKKITLGDIDDIPMDMEWLDIDENGRLVTKTVREIVRDAGDDELAAAMKACAI